MGILTSWLISRFLCRSLYPRLAICRWMTSSRLELRKPKTQQSHTIKPWAWSQQNMCVKSCSFGCSKDNLHAEPSSWQEMVVFKYKRYRTGHIANKMRKTCFRIVGRFAYEAFASDRGPKHDDPLGHSGHCSISWRIATRKGWTSGGGRDLERTQQQ